MRRIWRIFSCSGSGRQHVPRTCPHVPEPMKAAPDDVVEKILPEIFTQLVAQQTLPSSVSHDSRTVPPTISTTTTAPRRTSHLPWPVFRSAAHRTAQSHTVVRETVQANCECFSGLRTTVERYRQSLASSVLKNCRQATVPTHIVCSMWALKKFQATAPTLPRGAPLTRR